MTLPKWMRIVLSAAAVLNGLGAFIFTPAGTELRQFSGLSLEGHPFYLWISGSFILIFGFAYLWAGMTGRADPLFIAVGAAGKLAFFGLTVAYWILGELPVNVPRAAVSDFILALIFIFWLFSAKTHRATLQKDVTHL